MSKVKCLFGKHTYRNNNYIFDCKDCQLKFMTVDDESSRDSDNYPELKLGDNAPHFKSPTCTGDEMFVVSNVKLSQEEVDDCWSFYQKCMDEEYE